MTQSTATDCPLNFEALGAEKPRNVLEPIPCKLVSNRKFQGEAIALVERDNHGEPRVEYVLAHLWLHMLKDSHPSMLKARVIHRHTNP